jgi:hypothetical protein
MQQGLAGCNTAAREGSRFAASNNNKFDRASSQQHLVWHGPPLSPEMKRRLIRDSFGRHCMNTTSGDMLPGCGGWPRNTAPHTKESRCSLTTLESPRQTQIRAITPSRNATDLPIGHPLCKTRVPCRYLSIRSGEPLSVAFLRAQMIDPDHSSHKGKNSETSRVDAGRVRFSDPPNG